MSTFFSKYKFLIIGVVVIVAIFITYAILKPAPQADGTIEKTTVSGASRSSGTGNPGAADNLSDEFVVQLLAIQNINFNTDFFNDPVYRNLIDQYRPLGDRPVGRPNPFYPIGQDNGFIGTSTAGLSGQAEGTDASAIASTSSATSTVPRATTTSRTRTPARR